MIRQGDVVARLDVPSEVYVIVLSNGLHLAAATGRTVVCPYVPGILEPNAVALSVRVDRPAGTVLPEMVQSVPTASLGTEPIGRLDDGRLALVAQQISALIDP